MRGQNKIAIEAAIDRLGFTVNEFARSLKTSKSRTVGVVIPELGNVFITTIITVVEDILRKSGYGVLICDCRSDEAREREAVCFLLSKRVDGILNMPISKDGGHLLPAVQNGLPLILLDRMIPELKDRVSAVLVDNVGGSALAVRTLLEAGHKNIGVILGPQDVFTSQQRLLGYNQMLIESMLQPEPSRIVFSDYSAQGGYESMKLLLADPAITAVFVTNYDMTLGAVIAANELGVKIPQDISLIGFDNLQLSRVIRPSLTIITQPLEEIGQSAAELLLEQLSRKAEAPTPKTIILPTGMLNGESVIMAKK